jgi:hypothetical protein
MRPITAPQRALLMADNRVHLRVRIANAGGTLIDRSAYVEGSQGVEIRADVDSGAVTASIAIARAGMQPLINSNIDVDRLVSIEAAVTTPTGTPAGGDWRNIFYGFVDKIQWDADPMQLTCRDLTKRLLDTQVRVPLPYGSNASPVAIETVIQDIIDDNAPVTPAPPWNPYPTVQTSGGSPGAFLTQFNAPLGNLYEVVLLRALQIGYDLRYHYGTSALPFLDLYLVDRVTPTVLDTFQLSEYIEVTDLAFDDEDVRNYGELEYYDVAAGQLQTVTSFDNVSIAKYGQRYFKIAGEAVASLTTSAEAQAMIDAAVADLSWPRAHQSVRMRFFWPVELQDFYEWGANTVHYITNQGFAVFGFVHTFRNGSAETEIIAGGNPIGAFDAWLRSDAGEIPGFPEILFVSAPTEIVGAGNVVTGFRVSGRVDSDTQVVIATLSSGLTMKSSTPNYVTVTNGSATEYWLNVLGNGFFTIEVNLVQGDTGTLTLVPATTYNPTDVPPSGGVRGFSFVQRLSRTPITSIHFTEPTLTTRNVTLTVRPATAEIKYRFAGNPPGPGSLPWLSATGGKVSFGIDISAGDVLLEYYGVSVAGVVEEIHSIVFDIGTIPNVTLYLAESNPNELTATVGIDDDTVEVKVWARRAAYPDLSAAVPSSTDMDPLYLRATLGRNRPEISFFAAGANNGTADTWHVVAVGYDRNGRPGPPDYQTIVIKGTAAANTVGALSNLSGVVVGGSGVELRWAHNAVIAAASSSRFTVQIDENGVNIVSSGAARSAKTDPSGSDTISNAGGYLRSITPSTQGASGAQYFEFTWEVRLYDTGSFVAAYIISVQGWFIASSSVAAPTGTPGTPSATLNPLIGGVDFAWTPANATYETEIEVHDSTNNFTGSDVVFENAVRPLSAIAYTSYGHSPTIYTRARARFVNIAGVGSWTGYSNIVQQPPGGAP